MVKVFEMKGQNEPVKDVWREGMGERVKGGGGGGVSLHCRDSRIGMALLTFVYSSLIPNFRLVPPRCFWLQSSDTWMLCVFWSSSEPELTCLMT